MILNALAAAPHLEEVDLSGNWIGDEGIVHVKRFLRNSCCVRKLRLRWNGFSEDATVSLRPALRTKGGKRLVELDLGGNHLGNVGATQISRMLVGHRHLRVLRLDQNGMQSAGCTAIVLALHNNSVLQVLDVSGNQIGDKGAFHLAGLLARPNGGAPLVSVSLQLNLLIGDTGAAYLATAMRSRASCNRLQQLDLGGNKIGNEGGAQLARAARDCPALLEMWTDDNVGWRCGPNRSFGTCRTGVKNRAVAERWPAYNASVTRDLKRWGTSARLRRRAMIVPSWWRAPLRANVLRQRNRADGSNDRLAKVAAYHEKVYPLASRSSIAALTSGNTIDPQHALVYFTSAPRSLLSAKGCEGHAWSRCRLTAFFDKGLQPPRIEKGQLFAPFRLAPGMCMRSEFAWTERWASSYPYADGLADQGWTEIAHTREQMGGAWLYRSPGSGIFWNCGRSLRARNKVHASLLLVQEAMRLVADANRSIAHLWRARLKMTTDDVRWAPSEWLARAVDANDDRVCAGSKRCRMFMDILRSNRTNRNDNCYGRCSLAKAGLAVWFDRAANGSGAIDWQIDHLAASSVFDTWLYACALRLGYDSVQLTMQPQVWCGLGWTTEMLDLRVRVHRANDLVPHLSIRDPLDLTRSEPCLVRRDNASRKAFQLVAYCEGGAMEQTARCLSDAISRKRGRTIYSQYPRHRFDACMMDY